MGTLPTTGENLDLIGFELEEQPSYTHKLDIEGQRVAGMTDKREALRQAVYLILNVERYAYPIYSRNYGSELVDLIGQPMDYAMSEMKRRITDALMRMTASPAWMTGPLKPAESPCWSALPSTPFMESWRPQRRLRFNHV